MTAARETVSGLGELNWERVAAAAAHDMARGMVSKFQPCLPEDAEDRLLAEKLLDLGGTLRFLGSVEVSGVRAAPRSMGIRLRDTRAAEAFVVELQAVAPRSGAATPQNEIQWVDTPAALRSVSEELQGEEAVGLDVETTLDFGTLCLVQIATRSRTYLIDPFAVGDLAPLGQVLGASRPQKVIHHASFERRVLAAVGIPLQGVLDTLEASRQLRGAEVLGGHSLAMVCERELGLSLDKEMQTSNWSQRPLGLEQLRYAALSAEILLKLQEHFKRAGIATFTLGPQSLLGH